MSTAVRSILLLHQMQDQHTETLLHELLQETALRTDEHAESLRHATRGLANPQRYIQQAAVSLTRLEQRPDSVASIVRFRQAADILRFLHVPLPVPLMERALVVRTVGGENLSLVRAVLEATPSVAIEHVCLVRKEAILLLLHHPDSKLATTQLLQTLAHPNPAVQLTAMYGLNALEAPSAIDALLPIAKDLFSPVRTDAQKLIARLNPGSADALTLLRSLDEDFPLPQHLLRSILMSKEETTSLLRPTQPEESGEQGCEEWNAKDKGKSYE